MVVMEMGHGRWPISICVRETHGLRASCGPNHQIRRVSAPEVTAVANRRSQSNSIYDTDG